MNTSLTINELKNMIKILTAEKKKSEKLLRENSNNLEQIIACIPGSVFWKDQHGVYQGCIAKAFIKVDQEIIDSGIPQLNLEEPTFHFSDGKDTYQLSNKMPLIDKKGNVVGIAGIGIDITELKNTQALLKKEKEHVQLLSNSKSEFIANMSHDVKTPLSGIIGLSEILKERLEGEDLSFTEDIITAAQQLMAFFNTCLEIAKADHIDITLTKEQFSLKALITDISDLFRPAVKNKKLHFSIHYDEKVPEIFIGSREAIYRILLNLTGNAIKFTSAGGLDIYLNLDDKSSTEKRIILKVVIQDTGIGIPTNKQKVIFEQFTRLTSSYEGIYEGSGIGLFMVNKLVKSLHGEIHVNSEEGKGSQFTVMLPLEIP